jgi:Transposase, Mutator family
VIANQAVLIAVAVDWEGRRQVLAVALANRESRASWKDFPLALKRRRPSGVERALRMSCLTIIPASRPRYEKSCPRQLGGAATCASRGMRWTTRRAKWMTIASRSCAKAVDMTLWVRQSLANGNPLPTSLRWPFH